MNARIETLRKSVCIKAVKDVRRGYEITEEGKGYRENVKLCLERARLLTASYQETEGEPMVLRRAKALAKILENMTIYIKNGELIVGNFASDPSSLPYYPELYWRWLEKAVNDGYRNLLDDKGREELGEIDKYWKNKAVHGMERDYLPQALKKYWYYNGAGYWTHHWYNALPDYKKLLRIGLDGLVKDAEEKLKEINNEDALSKSIKGYIEKKRFLDAVIIALNAGIKFSQRYAEKARELARLENEENRGKELEKIADICDWVPGNPARTFHEALQFFFFVHLIASFIELPLIGIGVRLDQILYPFYKRDLEEGRLTREEALELIECLWIKFEEGGFLHPPIWAGIAGGGLSWQNVTIGGVTPEGEDATNELSYLILEATKDLQTTQPPLGFRYHDKVPKELVFKAIDLLRSGAQQPAFFNDEVIIPMILSTGIPIEGARDYSISNCMFWITPNMMYRPSALGYIMLPKCLEFALNRGRDKFSGEQIGYPTPDPIIFTSIEEIMQACLKQYTFFVAKLVSISQIADALYEEYTPRPFLSALLDGCIENGEDCSKWNHHRWTLIVGGGINVADSLAAIKKLVFEEKRVSMPDLLDTLRNDWEGKEDLRQIFLNEAPKFGNDDDYVDLIAKELYYKMERETKKFAYRGVPLTIDGSILVTGYSFGIDTGATPDGRKDREAFHDGTISPAQGRDKKGPTAVLKSVSKIDPLLSFNHLLNQRFAPVFLEGKNREVFANYLKTWADLGIHHIQFNVVNKELMLDAQQHPERHTDLIVRVAGYAAYFVDLSRGLQDDIIRRTEQSFYSLFEKADM